MAHWKEPLDVERHRDYVSGAQDAGGVPIDRKLSDGWVYFVQVCGFTFSFANLDQVREAIQYFGHVVHPARRVPGRHLEHYWQRWFERLPPGLNAGSKRGRVRRALTTALAAFTSARPISSSTRSHHERSALMSKRVAIAGLIPSDAVPDAIVASLQRFTEERGGVVHGVVLQRRGVSRSKAPGGAAAARRGAPLSSATFLGTGKTMELARLCRAQRIDVILFLNALPRAQRNRIETLTATPIVFAPRELVHGITSLARPA